MKVLTVVGARPQFIKAAAVSRALRQRHEEILVHTGQHYDFTMSGIFFEGLDLPAPDHNLEVGSGQHGEQTGAMLAAVERVLLQQRPDWVLVYGDTNSTLAGALAASKLHLPVIHVEAGLRSFNRRMPEEINRVVSDHLSTHLVCPSETAVANLAREGIRKNVHLLGDVMSDVLFWARDRVAASPPPVLERLGLREKDYCLVTLHRGENTDDPSRMEQLVGALNALPGRVVFPVHPRTRKALEQGRHALASGILAIEPLGYLEMVALVRSARMVLTDSGGLQKEAYWLEVPCLTLREETEWVETVDHGWNRVVGADRERIVAGARDFEPPTGHPTLYGDGKVAARLVDLLG